MIDGAFRDKEGCEEAGVPIFARCVVPGSAGKCQQGKLNTTVVCGGAEVNPGDYIVADVNGVVVIRPDEVESVMKNAEAKLLRKNLRFRKWRKQEKYFLELSNFKLLLFL